MLYRTVITGLLCAIFLPPAWAMGGSLTMRDTVTEFYFSPRGGTEAAIVRAIGAAKQEVCVQAFGFTSAPVADALIQAAQRGVRVRVILDKSQRTARASKLRNLLDAGIPVVIDSAHRIAHNKVIVIDQRRVITGSFNFSKSAEESNAENLLILDDAPLSEQYLQNFEAHEAHGETVQP